MNKKEEYLKLFQTEASKKFSAKAQELAGMKAGLSELRAYMKSEKENITAREKEIAELEATLDFALRDAKSCDDFKVKMQSYKDELVKLKSDLQTSRGLVLTLEKTIPRKQVECETAANRLQTAIAGFVRLARPVADEQLKKWMMEIIEERTAFLDAFTEIHKQFGVNFVMHSTDLFPGGLTRLKLAELKKALGITDDPPADSSAKAQPFSKTHNVRGGQALNRETRKFLDRNEQKRQAESKNENNAKTASK